MPAFAGQAKEIMMKVSNSRIPPELLNFSRWARNVFCPTGKGGGVDPTCSSGNVGVSMRVNRKESTVLASTLRAQESSNLQDLGFSEAEAALLSQVRDKFVLRDGDKIRGAVSLYPKEDGYVGIEHMGAVGGVKGTGSKLLELAASHAVNSGAGIKLQSSEVAHGFYQKMGFVRDSGDIYTMEARQVVDLLARLSGPAKVSDSSSVSKAATKDIGFVLPEGAKWIKGSVGSMYYKGGKIYKVKKATENSNDWQPLDNVFCPTGKGGGIDPTCGEGGGPAAPDAKGGTGSSSASPGGTPAGTNETKSGGMKSLKAGKGPDTIEGRSHKAPDAKQLMSAIDRSKTHGDWTTGEKKTALDDDRRQDHFHVQQLKELGYDAKPRVITTDQLDAEVAGGATILYRGFPSGQFANDYRTGELFGGRGIYGNGTYTAYDTPPASGTQRRQKHPDNAALNLADNYAGNGKGVVARMTLAKDAKIVEFDQVKGERDKFLGEIDGRIKGLGMTFFSKEKKAEKARLERLRQLYDGQFNLGRYASLAGYDAIRHSGEKFVSILNRGKVSIEAHNYVQE